MTNPEIISFSKALVIATQYLINNLEPQTLFPGGLKESQCTKIRVFQIKKVLASFVSNIHQTVSVSLDAEIAQKI